MKINLSALSLRLYIGLCLDGKPHVCLPVYDRCESRKLVHNVFKVEKRMKSAGFIGKYVKIIVLLAVIAGSSSGIFGRAIEAPSMAIGFWRLTLGLPFFAIPVLIKKRHELKAISGKEAAGALLAGAFLFAHFFSWFNAVKMTNIASAVVLAALHPLVVLVITLFVFKKHVGARPIMGIVLALLGGTLVAGLDKSLLSAGNFNGDVLAFLAAVFMGVYFAIGNEVRKTVEGAIYVFLCFFGCWICFVVGTVATDTRILGYSTRDYILMALLTLVCQIGAHAVFNLCFGYVDSLYVSAWESGESVFAIVLSFIFLGQIPTSWELLGAVIVVIGLLYYNYHTSIEEKMAEKVGSATGKLSKGENAAHARRLSKGENAAGAEKLSEGGKKSGCEGKEDLRKER